MKGTRTGKTPKEPKRPTGREVICFYNLVLDLCRTYGEPRFVMEDEFRKKTRVWVTGEGIWVNGTLQDKKNGRVFIAEHREAFEALFVQAMKQYTDIRTIMPRISLANLLDTSAVTGKSANMKFSVGKDTAVLHIEHKDGIPKMTLNTQSISVEEAEKFIEENYMQFLAGAKSANRSMTHERSQNSKHKEYRAKQKANMHKGVQHSKVVDGELIVDLKSFIPQRESHSSEQLKRKPLELGKKSLGYIDNEKET